MICDRYDCPMSGWIPACKEIGGPVNVDLNYCMHADTGCDAFKSGHCIFNDHTLLAKIEGNFKPENCQVSTVSRIRFREFENVILFTSLFIFGFFGV